MATPLDAAMPTSASGTYEETGSVAAQHVATAPLQRLGKMGEARSSPAGAVGSSRLLRYMRQLMGQQAAAFRSLRSISVSIEKDIGLNRNGICVKGTGRLGCAMPGVNADVAKIHAQTGFEKFARGGVEGVSSQCACGTALASSPWRLGAGEFVGYAVRFAFLGTVDRTHPGVQGELPLAGVRGPRPDCLRCAAD